MSGASESAPRDLSVVVVVLSGRAALERCLSGLGDQEDPAPEEVIVPHDDTLPDVQELRARHPWVRFIHSGGERHYAELRSLGFREADGEIVALTEDHCIPDPNWCAAIRRHHRDGADVVGGRVERDRPPRVPASDPLDWAVYLSDFHRYVGPVDEGDAGYLTDCNVSYRREVLERIRSLWDSEFHETTVNWALEDAGCTLRLADDVVVRQHRSLPASYVFRERFAFGRLFASTRVREIGPAGRLAYAASSVLLPPLLVARVLRSVVRKRRYVSQTLRCLPHLLLVNTVWGLGEFTGYLTGCAGDIPYPPGRRTESAFSVR